jgi:hypothetical protein
MNFGSSERLIFDCRVVGVSAKGILERDADEDFYRFISDAPHVFSIT